jgi:hypothetical protein
MEHDPVTDTYRLNIHFTASMMDKSAMDASTVANWLEKIKQQMIKKIEEELDWRRMTASLSGETKKKDETGSFTGGFTTSDPNIKFTVDDYSSINLANGTNT